MNAASRPHWCDITRNSPVAIDDLGRLKYAQRMYCYSERELRALGHRSVGVTAMQAVFEFSANKRCFWCCTRVPCGKKY